MPDQQSAPAPLTPATAKVARTGENRYPKYDLNSCLALAKKVKDEGGNDCTVEQLGALLGYKNTNGGGFATRVGNAKAFGLIETVQSRYRTTQRAEAILYPSTPNERQQAMVDAFLSVPMYKRVYEMHKGQRLPEFLGLQNLLHRQFSIPAGDAVTMALRVLMDSAEQAGFFTATQGKRTNLVVPIMGSSDAAIDQPLGAKGGQRATGGGGPGGGQGNGGDEGRNRASRDSRGTLVDGMWELLPQDEHWDEGLMADWLDMLKLALRVRYKLPSKN